MSLHATVHVIRSDAGWKVRTALIDEDNQIVHKSGRVCTTPEEAASRAVLAREALHALGINEQVAVTP